MAFEEKRKKKENEILWILIFFYSEEISKSKKIRGESAYSETPSNGNKIIR